MLDEEKRDLERLAATGDYAAKCALEGERLRVLGQGRRYLPPVHVSAETAYVVDDYPYGFRLRCTMRIWIETKGKHGQRVVTQTSNPKKPGAWNKPKPSTYTEVRVLYVDEATGHVENDALSIHSPEERVTAFETLAAAAIGPVEAERIKGIRAFARAMSRVKWTVTERPMEPIDLSAPDAQERLARLSAEAEEHRERERREGQVIGALIANERAAIDGKPLPVPSLGTAGGQ